MSAEVELPIEGKTIKALHLLSLKRTFEMFNGNHGESLPADEESQRIKLACKVKDEYAAVQHLSVLAAAATNGKAATASAPRPAGAAAAGNATAGAAPPKPESRSSLSKLIDTIPVTERQRNSAEASTSAPGGGALVSYRPGTTTPGTVEHARALMEVLRDKGHSSAAVSRRLASKWPRPQWRAPWRLYRVISGHLGWVRSVSFDPSNEWFATGSSDRTIKLWETASGQLKLTLTGHIEQVTALAVSGRHPYMFSASLDKQVKCWDLEHNKVIRNYHGHLSGVYSLALHPTLDIVASGGRDSVARIWDMRSKVQVFALSGHQSTVAAILAQPTDPQIITGSHDSTIRLWDLRKGQTLATLTYHKKSVRALVAHPTEFAFASAGADNIKKFKLPAGDFIHNMLSQQRSIVNTLALNEDGVMASGGDNGSLWLWDWASGHCFQTHDEPRVQPGSLESEAGVYASAFDLSGSRLVTCEADKTIKMWKEVEGATPETHPGLPFRPPKDLRRF